jgi:protein-tyrosine phosphatase
MKILMVCLGNICRSPVAEGIMKLKAAKYHLILEIDSAGTSGWHNGAQPDERSIKNATKNGVDISKQESRRVMLSDFELFDVVYAMDKENYHNLINLAPHGLHHKIKMILNETNPGEDKSVPDPYYTEDGFDEVFSLLDQACETIALNIKKL